MKTLEQDFTTTFALMTARLARACLFDARTAKAAGNLALMQRWVDRARWYWRGALDERRRGE